MAAYYNENDPKAAAWLRELIKAGAIAPGEVDERSILDVTPAELAGYTQCHFFAGIGVWSYALRLAGWPDALPVWTGSCPCQPFSAAGKGDGFADERHLWPYWFHLIMERRPPIIFGEQVASKNADAWLDLVQDDLEALGYAFGAVAFPAAGVGAPHIRDRTYWVAESLHAVRRPFSIDREDGRHGAMCERQEAYGEPGACSEVRRLADANGGDASTEREQRSGQHGQQPQDGGAGSVADPTGDGRGEMRQDAGGVAAGDRAQGITAGLVSGINAGRLGDRERERLEGHAGHVDYPRGRAFALGSVAASGAVGGFWRNAEVVYCRDGKLRPVEPGTFPLVDGTARTVGHLRDPSAPITLPTSEARTMRLRGYGNAIVATAAAEFIRAFCE